ncbi:MAG: branched-chain amino acid ABC transporter permease [Acidimicrobiia bacterium]
MAQLKEAVAVEEQLDLHPPRQRVDLVHAARLGLIGGFIAVLVGAIGMLEAFQSREVVQPFLTFSTVSLLVIAMLLGYLAGRRPPPLEGEPPAQVGPGNLLAGGTAGATAGLVLGVFAALAQAVNLRPVFPNVTPGMVRLLTFDQGVGAGLAILFMGGLVVGALGAGLAIAPARWQRALSNALLWVLVAGLFEDFIGQILTGFKLRSVDRLVFNPRGGLSLLGTVILGVLVFGLYWSLDPRRAAARTRLLEAPEERRRNLMLGGLAALVVALAILPSFLGPFVAEVLDLVGIFLLMGLGLNIVVGYAGLLDLGYVAFFAVGAYTTAILTSPLSPRWSPELVFWAAIPFVVLAAALAGIIVGTPVLRMRGDYLAIVTLGFGEIARLLFLSDWLRPFVNAARGITRIPNIPVGTIQLNTAPQLFYPIAAFSLLAAYVSWALYRSRIGRAWMAMREDEPVAEVMGINIVTTKLSAFIMGAILAGFGGALFAAKIGSVFPHSFNILVSITVLVLIIVGGMGNIPGVVVGSLLLVGIPNILREFEEYRLLMYGALLIFMMLYKPEGFLPSRQRARELHQDEALQDAWILEEQEQRVREQPATMPAD